MPLELELRRIGGGNFGTIDQVHQAIAAVLPGTRFWKEPSGAEQIRIAREKGIEFPPILRENLEKMAGSYRGDYESGGVSLEFLFGSSDWVEQVYMDVRGSGDALETISRVAAQTRSKAICLATGTEVKEADWSGFQEWRDGCTQKIKSEQDGVGNSHRAGQ